ncbi:MAG: hypothetical protein QME68_01415 [Elusimicrobiota bacterium]|nr:hypothetical protein [Elusimicrobiota bacterium]
MKKSNVIVLIVILVFVSSRLYPEIKYNPSQLSPTSPPSEPKPFGFSKERWNEMRRAIEEGRKPGEKVEVSTKPVKLELPPPPPGAVVELPYETRLSISGRKFIGLNIMYKKYDKKPEIGGERELPSFDMKQELQVKIKGQVGRKISVNVDFDDTVPDKRDISVVYKGDPEEFVQEASFGDIVIALPNTEFVGYSKQAFGIKLVTKYKNLRTIFIGSQAKGLSETKRFTGKTTLQRPTILDTSYCKKKYYLLAFTTETIKSGTEVIYVDDRNPNNNQNAVELSYSTYTVNPSSWSTGFFDKYYPGQHYTVDYSKGIIIFRSSLPSNYIVCVSYQKTDGSYIGGPLATGNTHYILIKDEQNTPGVTRELKNYYDLGRKQIIRDNGRRDLYQNFFLRIVTDAGETPENIPNSIALEPSKPDYIVSGTTAVPKYPDNIIVDFESGFFYIEGSDGKPWYPFPKQVYEGEGTHSNYKFFVEYRYREKTFMLRPMLVPQSERVILDGKLLTRDVDYFIDYDGGILTFVDESKITDTSVIDVSYDYSLFGLQVGETFAGLRSELSLTRNWFVGASYMQNFPGRPQTIPDLRSVQQDLAVWEVDSRISNLALGPFRLGLSGEYAGSSRNMNTYGSAMLESMEGIKQEDSPSLHKDSWKYGRAEEQYPPDAISWSNTEEYIKDIYGITTTKDEKQSVLKINYDLSYATTNATAAIVQSMSTTGLDFTKKQFLELRLKAQLINPGPNNKLIIEVGSFNEDVDWDGKLDTEDTNRNGILNEGEDIGWTFNPSKFPGKEKQVGEKNGLIDSEDLDNDGMLDTFDWVIPRKNKEEWEIDLNSTKEWVRKQIDLGMVAKEDWRYVKQIRIRIDAAGSGEIRIAKIAFVGNKWESLSPGLTVQAINNYDDKNYISLIDPASRMRNKYEELYGELPKDTTKREQALELRYDFSVSTPNLTAKLAYTRPQDFSLHKKLKFFVYGNGNNETLSFIAGSDDNNYFEYKISSVCWTGWRLLTINQEEERPEKLRIQVPNKWTAESIEYNPGKYITPVCISTGPNPSLQNIMYIKVIVSSSTEFNPLNERKWLWINEIHFTEPFTRKGSAYRVSADLSLPGWFSLSGTHREIDANFETFAQPIKNQKSMDTSANLSFTRLSFNKPVNFSIPINVSASQSETRTPSVERAGEMVTATQEDTVIKQSLSGNTSLTLWKLPRFGLSYSISISTAINKAQKIHRVDTEEKKSYTIDYSVSIPKIFKLDLIDSLYPNSIALNASRTTTMIVSSDVYKSTQTPTVIETSDSGSIRAPFQIWKRLTLSPSYTQTHIYEDKWVEGFPKPYYTKSRKQQVTTSASLRVTRWFSPSANYSISTDETYNFTESSPALISKLKVVNRTGSGDVSASFGIRDILPNFKPTQSLNLSGSWRFDDGDKYENLPGDYPALKKLWIREAFEEKLSLQTQKDTWRVSLGWTIFEGIPLPNRLKPLNRTRTSATFSKSEQHNYNKGTRTRNYVLGWPDLIFNFYDTERIFGVSEKFISSSQIDFRTSQKLDSAYTIIGSSEIPQTERKSGSDSIDARFNLLKNYSISTHYGQSQSRSCDFLGEKRRITSLSKSWDFWIQTGLTIRRIQLTPRYSIKEDKAWPGDPAIKEIAERPTQDLQTQTFELRLYADTSFPGGITLPFVRKTLGLTNRCIFNANYSFTRTDTKKGDVARNKTDRHSFTGNADYEVSANLRASVGLGFERFLNRQEGKEKENYTSYTISAKLNIIF